MQKKTEGVTLEATIRASSGKQVAARVRREGLVPAVVYGEEAKTLHIQVKAKELTKALRTKAGENVLITLQVRDDSKKHSESAVLIRELQHHPVSHQIIHVDFHRISLTKRITVTVPLAFQGEAAGVKQEGGILEHIRWDLEVECLPTEIPSQIAVDVSQLAVGKTLYVKDVPMPPGVRLITNGELPVVACVMPKVEEVVPPPAEAAAEAVEPEVIKQKKPEELTAEEAAKEKEGEAEKEKKKEKEK